MGIVPAAYEFQMDGEPVACEEFGHGHINSTYKITTDTGHEYVLQKINKYVFHNPVQLMANANAVTSFIREREADPRAAIHFIPTRNDDGSFCHRDSDGEFWRMYDYVGGFCVDQPETDEDFYRVQWPLDGSSIFWRIFRQIPCMRPFPTSTIPWTGTASWRNPSGRIWSIG